MISAHLGPSPYNPVGVPPRAVRGKATELSRALWRGAKVSVKPLE